MCAARLSLLSLVVALVSAAPLYATDLAVTKSADKDTVVVGDTLTFTIVIDNTSTFGGGPLPTGVDLFDRHTPGLRWLDIAGDIALSDCQETEADDGFDCSFDIAAGEVKTATVSFIVTEAGEQSNGVSAVPTIGDPDPNNNEAEAVVTVEEPPEAELRVTKTADMDTVTVGDIVTFTIEVENLGSVVAEDVKLTDLSDTAQLQFESASPGCVNEATETTNIVECDLVGLIPGETGVVEITFTALERGEIENAVGVSGSNTGDEVSDHVTILAGEPELRIMKTADPDPPEIGQLVTYTITVENTGNLVAEDVSIEDRFLTGDLFFADAIGCDFKRDPNGFGTVECEVGDLEPGGTASVELDFWVMNASIFGLAVGNTGSARAANHERVTYILELGVLLFDADVVSGIFFESRDDAGDKRGGQRASQQKFDVYVDSLIFIDGLESGMATSMTDFPLGAIAPFIHVVPTGGDLTDAILAEQVDFFTGELAGDDFFLPDTYVLLIAGPEDSPTLLLQRDARFEAQDPAEVDIFFVHAAPNAPALSLRRFDTGEMLTDDLTFGAVTDYTSLTPAIYTLEATNTDGDVLDVFEIDVSNRQGEASALIIAPIEGDTPDDVALVVLDAEGNASASPIVTAAKTEQIPERFALHGSYPNPFNPTTTLRFDLPEPAEVRVEVYDMLGRRVLELTPRPMPAGFNRTMPVDGSSLASGIYLYSVSATAGTTTTTQTGRLVVLK